MEPHKTEPKRILLVDDDEAVRQTIGLLLRRDKHAVIAAADGAEALDLLKGDRFDLVITDFDMPGMLGTELATRIKRQSPAQPILMITACAQKLPPVDNAVDALLEKPFPVAELRGAITALLNNNARPGCAARLANP
jgi:DNA-binding response OmpR family regulator